MTIGTCSNMLEHKNRTDEKYLESTIYREPNSDWYVGHCNCKSTSQYHWY